MTLKQKQIISQKETIAVYDGFGGIEIKDMPNEYGETYVIFTDCTKRVHKIKVFHSKNGAYFTFNGVKIFLNECLRVKIK